MNNFKYLLALGTIILSSPAYADSYGLLKTINREVNFDIKPMSDMEQYGYQNIIAEPPSGYGDCKDYAATKLARLAKRGYYKGRAVPVRTRSGQLHMVVVAEGWVLDNLSPLDKRPHKIKDATRAGYRFLVEVGE